MSKLKNYSRKNKQPSSRKNKKPYRKQGNKTRAKSGRKNSKQANTDKLTRRNWMKKLLFTGGDASQHAETVYGGIGQQHAMSDNNNAIYQNSMSTGGLSLPEQAVPM